MSNDQNQVTETDPTFINNLPAWRLLHIPPDCCPVLISKHFLWCGKCIPRTIQEKWNYLRSLTHWIVEHSYFEWLIIISILASSTALVSNI